MGVSGMAGGLTIPAWHGRVGGVMDWRLQEKGVKDECSFCYCLNKNGSKFWTRLSGLGWGT